MYLKSFLRGRSAAKAWQNFLWVKDWRNRQICKGKKWVKNWRILKVVFNGNDRYHRIEHEILSKKVYYNKSHTQTHKEIRPFAVWNTVISNTIDVKFCLNHNRTDSISNFKWLYFFVCFSVGLVVIYFFAQNLMLYPMVSFVSFEFDFWKTSIFSPLFSFVVLPVTSVFRQ